MRIFFFGNCQVQALYDIFRTHVAPITGDTPQLAYSFAPLNAEARAGIEAADVLVTQIAHFEPQTDITAIPTAARQMRVPVSGTPFIWPYSGTPHPDSHRKFGKYHPYPQERSDSWLLRQLAAGMDPDAAVDAYLRLDIARAAHLDRRLEMELDMLRARERGTPYQTADLIAAHFRTEKLFRTPYHPTLRIARYMALTFLRDLGVPDAAYARVEQRLVEDPYLKFELPVHPGIAAHYGLGWAPPDQRYRFYTEAWLTFEEYMRRFVRCEAYPEVTAAQAAVSRNEPDARAKIEHALALVPDSPWSHQAMGVVLLREDRPAEALPWLQRAQSAYPSMPNLHAQICECLHKLGRPREGLAALAEEIRLQPFNLRMHVFMAEGLEALGDYAEAAAALGRAVDIEPAREDLARRRQRILRKLRTKEQPVLF